MSDYHESTIEKLYSRGNVAKGERRPLMLAMQKRHTTLDLYCLLCDRYFPHFTASDHINSKQHAICLEDFKERLSCYHQFWSSQSKEIQLHQIHFNLLSTRAMFCTICKKPAAYAEGLHEKCVQDENQLLTNCLVPEHFRNTSFNYDDGVQKRFSFSTISRVCLDIFQTSLPLGYKKFNHYVCLLCRGAKTGKVFFKEYEITWFMHLRKCHCENNKLRMENLQLIVDFHRFWSNVPSDQQNYLRYFTIFDSQHFLCHQNHTIPIKEAINHVEEQKCCNSEKAKINKSGDSWESGEHVIFKCVQDLDDTDLFHLVPTYMRTDLQQHFILCNDHKSNDRKVYCKPCKVYMEPLIGPLKDHIARFQHSSKCEKKVVPDLRYNCMICNFKVNNAPDWLNHLGSERHRSTEEHHRSKYKTKFQEYQCTGCKMVLFGSNFLMEQHKTASTKKEIAFVMTSEMKSMLKKPKEINAETSEMLKQSDRIGKELKPKLNKSLQILGQILSNIYPKHSLHVFGSVVTGLNTSCSDIDLFVDTDRLYDRIRSTSSQQEILTVIQKCLKAHPKRFDQISVILHTRIPLLRFVHNDTGLDFDLSCHNGLAIENTKFLKFCMAVQPKFREAALWLKRWASFLDPPLKHQCSTYALYILLVFQMQKAQTLPSIADVMQSGKIVGGYQVIDSIHKMDQVRKDLKGVKSTWQILDGFFKFYEKFDFDKYVLCPYLGYPVSKRKFQSAQLGLPDKLLKQYLITSRITEILNQFVVNRPMVVQDPFDLAHNLTKSISGDYLKMFQALCGKTANVLSIQANKDAPKQSSDGKT